MAPSYILEREATSWFTVPAPSITTASFDAAAGDVLILIAAAAGPSPLTTWSGGAPTNSGAALSWTLIRSSTVASYSPVWAWTAVVDTARTGMTVTLAQASGTQTWGLDLTVWRGGAIGASAIATGSGAPSLSLTTTAASSAIVVFNADYNASTAARTWRTGAGAATELVYSNNAGVDATYYGAYHANAGTAGAKTVGLSAPAGQAYTLLAIEIKTPATVTLTRSTTWGTLATAAATRATTWASRETVEATRSTTWNTDGLTRVALTRTTAWSVTGRLAVSRSTSWATLARVTTTRATTWAVLSTATATRSATWATLATVYVGRGSTWTAWSSLSWLDIMDDPRLLAALDDPRRMLRARIALVDSSGTEVGTLPITAGRVTYSGGESEQRTATFELADPSLVPHTWQDPLDSRSRIQAQVWWGIWMDEMRDWWEVPLGRLDLEDPGTRDSSTAFALTVKGRDPIARLKRAGYGHQVISVGGQTVTEALRALFAAVAPQLPVSIADTGTVLPGVYELGGRRPAQDAQEIAATAGWTVGTDRVGMLHAGPPPTPGAPRVSLAEGPTCPVIDLSSDIVTSEWCNSILVRGTHPDIDPPVWALAEDHDPGSPSSIEAVGLRSADPVDSDTLTTEGAAQAMADLLLAQKRRPTQLVKVTIPQRPDLDWGTVVSLARTKSRVSGDWQVQSWEIPLVVPPNPPQPMTVTFMLRGID